MDLRDPRHIRFGHVVLGRDQRCAPKYSAKRKVAASCAEFTSGARSIATTIYSALIVLSRCGNCWVEIKS